MGMDRITGAGQPDLGTRGRLSRRRWAQVPRLLPNHTPVGEFYGGRQVDLETELPLDSEHNDPK